MYGLLLYDWVDVCVPFRCTDVFHKFMKQIVVIHCDDNITNWRLLFVDCVHLITCKHVVETKLSNVKSTDEPMFTTGSTFTPIVFQCWEQSCGYPQQRNEFQPTGFIGVVEISDWVVQIRFNVFRHGRCFYWLLLFPETMALIASTSAVVTSLFPM